MKKFIHAVSILLCASVLITGCATAQKDYGTLKPGDLREAQEILKKIEFINSNLPESFTSRIAVKSTINGKSFSIAGNVYYASNPVAIKVMLNDLIFKSPVVEILLQADQLKIFMPIEQSVYIRNPDPERDTTASLEINTQFLSQTALGRIPLITGYTVTKSFIEEEQGKITGKRVVVLENKMYYESISVKNGIPDKVRILAKNGVDTFEVHFENPSQNDNVILYKNVSAFSENTGNNFSIEYIDLKLNAPFDRNKIFHIEIPRGTKVIQ